MKQGWKAVVISSVGVAFAAAIGVASSASAGDAKEKVAALFADWRAFEAPPLREGAPDYTAATVARRLGELAALRARIDALETGGWSVAEQVDVELIRAEMNGFEFHARTLKPWERDPAFYATVRAEPSDTPAHEGPNAAGIVELWTRSYPLSAAAAAELAAELRPIPAFLAQARTNLTGDARDLWTTGIGTMRGQARDLAELAEKGSAAGPELRDAVAVARRATDDFVEWLVKQEPSKRGPSGIGKEAYSWYERHVALLPTTWEDEVALLKRELARAHASLKLEEERNRTVPPLAVAEDDAEYQRRADRAIRKFVSFLDERKLYPMRGFMDEELRIRRGSFVPLATRNFFAIATHYEPLTLYTHSTHWWDLARARDEPHASPVRRGPMLYNVWAARSEGMATAMEELMLHAGLFDDEPRAREIVWILLAQRAARGLASLYLQANEMDIAKAKAFQVEWTPRGWMRPDLDLLGFEQQLYLRQPGYGTCYLVGKIQLEDLIRERAHAVGEAWTLRDWFDEVYRSGIIPVSLIRWELTGDGSGVRRLVEAR